MSDLTKAVALSGAIDPGMFKEFSKWKLPVEIPNDTDLYDSPEEAIEAIEEAMTGQEQVEVRATDLDVLKQFLRTKRKGKLHLVTSKGSGTLEIEFGVSTLGEYIIPWNADSIVDIMTNGESHILDVRRKVFVSDVTELYFGGNKAFMLCVPVKERHGKSVHKS
jgi:hypothetical protein